MNNRRNQKLFIKVSLIVGIAVWIIIGFSYVAGKPMIQARTTVHLIFDLLVIGVLIPMLAGLMIVLFQTLRGHE